jgi:transposase
VIQVHAVDIAGRIVVTEALPRDSFMPWCEQLQPGTLIAMEACSGAHHWTRKLRASGLDARMIAPHFVTPYRMQGKRGKDDANDAAAVCDAAARPAMRFVLYSAHDANAASSTDCARGTRRNTTPASTAFEGC